MQPETPKPIIEPPEIDHAPVFRLKVGDELRMKDQLYIVTKILKGGRAMIKRRGA